MQPYIFPYIGYFQLIAATDKFIFYDDVTFIKQGWINRNKILINGKESIFTVPLENSSSNKLIKDTEINGKFFPKWKGKFYKTVEQNYKKAPFFKESFEIIVNIFDKEYASIADLAKESVIQSSLAIGLNSEFVKTSTIYDNSTFKAQNRVIDICEKEGANSYINAIGGLELYSKDDFSKKGVMLNFLKPATIHYSQFQESFVPWLSIIDIMMFNSVEDIRKMIFKYELI